MKKYSPEVELFWQEFWTLPTDQQASFRFLTPPPNITGALHCGHALQMSVMDAMVRYKRMSDIAVNFQFGVDHAGIATQIVLEKIMPPGISDKLAYANEWKTETVQTFVQQLQTLGISIQTEPMRFTLDPEFNQAVIHMFVTLHRDQLIYRDKRIVNWDVALQSAISDIEVSFKAQEGFLYYLRYVGEQGELIAATTRPETIFVDAAIAVHPDDKRYQKWIGQKVQIPLTKRHITVIADEGVDPDFGTGCLKITPAHDPQDFKIGKKHHLTCVNMMEKDGRLNHEAPEVYRGIDRIKARTMIVRDLQSLLVKKEKYTHNVPICERTGSIIEPYVTTQWFVRMKPLSNLAIQAIEKEEVKFQPANWKDACLHWLHHIEDWCISRQLWFGHRIPAWYDEHNQVYVGYSEQEVRDYYQLDSKLVLSQDKDVLDTWASSALWPLATLGWPTSMQPSLYRNTVLVTGFDIMYFWVARMIMFGLYFHQEVPFHTVLITGLIRDASGQKMSKSKGNVINPIHVIQGKASDFIQTSIKTSEETFGADALRAALYQSLNFGQDANFQFEAVIKFKHFANKLWQAARFALMYQSVAQENKENLSLFEKNILSQLQHCIQRCNHYFETYQLHQAMHELYHFVWEDLCSSFIETVKIQLKPEEKSTGIAVLLDVLEKVLRLLHPLMPFITSEIWKMLFSKTVQLDTLPYPQPQSHWIHLKAEEKGRYIFELISTLRKMKQEIGCQEVFYNTFCIQEAVLIQQNQALIYRMSGIKNLNPHKDPGNTVHAMIAHKTVLTPHHVQPDEKKYSDLENKMQQYQAILKRSNQMLSNPLFLEKALPEIIQKEKERQKMCEAQIKLIADLMAPH